MDKDAKSKVNKLCFCVITFGMPNTLWKFAIEIKQYFYLSLTRLPIWHAYHLLFATYLQSLKHYFITVYVFTLVRNWNISYPRFKVGFVQTPKRTMRPITHLHNCSNSNNKPIEDKFTLTAYPGCSHIINKQIMTVSYTVSLKKLHLLTTQGFSLNCSPRACVDLYIYRCYYISGIDTNLLTELNV